MIKSKLATLVTQEMPNLSLRDIELAINQILKCMTDYLSRSERIELRNFGSFCLHYHPSRKAHNPQTGEKFDTKPSYSVHFKPGKKLRDRVNAQYGQPLVNHDDDE